MTHTPKQPEALATAISSEARRREPGGFSLDFDVQLPDFALYV
jgi:hypothetical protein